MLVLGLDLAGVESRPTGFCILSGDLSVKTGLIYGDQEILELTLSLRPSVVAIDKYTEAVEKYGEDFFHRWGF